MYVVSSLVGSKFIEAATIKGISTNTISGGENSTSKNNNNQHHHARVPSGKGVGEMPLAATVKSQMLRLLRRSKSTRGHQSGSSRSSSRKNGGGDTAMVIPNKRYSVLVDSSPSPNNEVVPVVEPYTMALGSPVAVTTPSNGSKHVDSSRKQTPNNTHRARESNHRSSSQARRHRTQIVKHFLSR
ncbi:hypothetical protein L9F63_020867, partial [Diploptera punctata]